MDFSDANLLLAECHGFMLRMPLGASNLTESWKHVDPVLTEDEAQDNKDLAGMRGGLFSRLAKKLGGGTAAKPVSARKTQAMSDTLLNKSAWAGANTPKPALDQDTIDFNKATRAQLNPSKAREFLPTFAAAADKAKAGATGALQSVTTQAGRDALKTKVADIAKTDVAPALKTGAVIAAKGLGLAAKGGLAALKWAGGKIGQWNKDRKADNYFRAVGGDELVTQQRALRKAQRGGVSDSELSMLSPREKEAAKQDRQVRARQGALQRDIARIRASGGQRNRNRNRPPKAKVGLQPGIKAPGMSKLEPGVGGLEDPSN